MTSAGFEETINNFIHSKTGEKIYLDIATENVIQLQPLCKRGSVPMGSFWVHVFQHSNNYPVYSYPYKKLYNAGSEYELKLRIDGISIIINLATGCLILKGPHVIDWFASRFLGILDGYSSPPGHHSKELKEHYTEAEMIALKKQKEHYYKNAIEIWPENVLHENANVMEAGKRNIYHEPSNDEGFLKGEDLESYSPIAELLDYEETVQQIEKLESGRVIQGNVLYKLWKSALNLWFSDKDGRVFIVTPHIDCDRLFDVCSLFLNHKLTACLDTLCVPLSNLHGRFAQVRSETIKRFLPRDQVFVEYKVYSSVVYPVVDFMNSFLVFVKDGKAKVLQTNTNFDRASFLTSALVSVQYHEIEEKQFVEAYLDPILH